MNIVSWMIGGASSEHRPVDEIIGLRDGTLCGLIVLFEVILLGSIFGFDGREFRALYVKDTR